MRQPSKKTIELVERLQALDLGNAILPEPEREHRANLIVQEIKEISESGDWSASLFLLSLMTSTENRVANEALLGIDTLLSNISAVQLIQLDKRMRHGWLSEVGYMKPWSAVDPSGLVHLDAPVNASLIPGLMSFHRHGYIRHSATTHLSRCHDGSELPFLLIRLSDWVRSIRELAEKFVDERVTDDYRSHFRDHLPLMRLVLAKQRKEAKTAREELFKRVVGLLSSSSNRIFLIDGLNHPEVAVRRECLRALAPICGEELQQVLELVLVDRDLTNRRASLELIEKLPVEQRRPYLVNLLSDKSPSLRRAALVALVEIVDEAEQRQLVLDALTDAGPGVREFARWKLKKLSAQVDFREKYIGMLKTAQNALQVVSALGGLRESGSAADADLIRPSLTSGSARVRRAAVRALATLSARDSINAFVEALGDQNPTVSLAAMKALQANMEYVDAEPIWSVFQSSVSWICRRNALMVMNRLSQWERLLYALNASLDSDERIRACALHLIDSWCDKFHTTWGYVPPTSEQKEEISAKLKLLYPTLRFPIARLDSCVAQWSRN